MLSTHYLDFNAIDAAQHIDALYKRPAWRRRQLLAGNDCARLLYKYFSFSADSATHRRNIHSVLVNSCLWFSKPSSFNDPFDFRCDARFPDDPSKVRKYLLSSARREANRVAANKAEARKEADRLFRIAFNRHLREPDSANTSFKGIRDRYGVCCFTTQPKSILMWAHYAESHTGLCFQFDSAAHFELLALARPIKYAPEFPRLEWPTDKGRVVEDVIFRKYEIWSYEDERRIVDRDCIDGPKAFSPGALKGIICGYRMSAKSRSELQDLLEERSRRGLPGVKLYQCVPEERSYKMKIVSLDFKELMAV